jgi:capsular exopolysaccharide synthesis family protein
VKVVEERLRLPVLARLPIIGDEKDVPDDLILKSKLDPKLITSDYAPHLAGESFRLLRTKISMEAKDQKKSFIIASLFPNEGKSLVSANLAITYAQQKIPTILIDCDLRRGVLHNSFAANKKPGLSDILIGKSELNLRSISEFIQKTQIPHLFLLSGGVPIPNPSELLSGNRMHKIYEVLNEEFEAIIFDTPPIDFIPDALILNNLVHKIILVVRYGKTNLNKLSDKILEFSKVKSDFLGIVINASEQVLDKKYAKYTYYNY